MELLSVYKYKVSKFDGRTVNNMIIERNYERALFILRDKAMTATATTDNTNKNDKMFRCALTNIIIDIFE